MNALTKLERVLLVVGIVLLAYSTLAYVSGQLQSRLALQEFRQESTNKDCAHEEPRRAVISDVDSQTFSNIDFTLWSGKRIRDYEASLAKHFGSPLAVLRIDRIRLEVPVFDGTDDQTLNRGVGRIEGTGRPGEGWSVGIAGHRDGFFRGLKDVGPGDNVQLITKSGTRTYVIDSVQVVSRHDVAVLESGQHPSLTLVTCYPFYFVGSAPKRYIVHASMQTALPEASRPARVSSKLSSLKEETR